MGLDLFHFKAITKPAIGNETFTETELRNAQGYSGQFEAYMQEIPDLREADTLYIFPNTNLFAKLAALPQYAFLSRSTVFFDRNSERTIQSIAKYERAAGLDSLEKLELNPEVAIGFRQSRQRVRYTSITYFRSGTCRGLYVELLGQQRNGMESAFYKKYHPDFVSCRKEDVLEAATFLTKSGAQAEELRHTYQRRFIDNFEAGRSIFCVSW